MLPPHFAHTESMANLPEVQAEPTPAPELLPGALEEDAAPSRSLHLLAWREPQRFSAEQKQDMLRLMQSSNLSVAAEALQACWNLTADADSRGAAVRLGAVPALVGALATARKSSWHGALPPSLVLREAADAGADTGKSRI